jgi:putative transposase
MTAIRYVELNPVKAGLAEQAESWPWSSARAHVSGTEDGLTDLGALAGLNRNWRAMLRLGLEAGDLPPDAEAAIESHQRTGRPLGDGAFVSRLESLTGRPLAKRKAGRKPRAEIGMVSPD